MANCRDRLCLTYGSKASLEFGERPGGGTRVVLLIPIDSGAAGNAS